MSETPVTGQTKSVAGVIAGSVLDNKWIAARCAMAGFVGGLFTPADLPADFGRALHGKGPELEKSTAITLGLKGLMGLDKLKGQERLSCLVGEVAGTLGGGATATVGLTALTGAGGAVGAAGTAMRVSAGYQAVMTTAAAATASVATAGTIDTAVAIADVVERRVLRSNPAPVAPLMAGPALVPQ